MATRSVPPLSAPVHLAVKDILIDLDLLAPFHVVSDNDTLALTDDEATAEAELLSLLDGLEGSQQSSAELTTELRLIKAYLHSRALLSRYSSSAATSTGSRTEPGLLDDLHARVAHMQAAIDERQRNWTRAMAMLRPAQDDGDDLLARLQALAATSASTAQDHHTQQLSYAQARQGQPRQVDPHPRSPRPAWEDDWESETLAPMPLPKELLWASTVPSSSLSGSPLASPSPIERFYEAQEDDSEEEEGQLQPRDQEDEDEEVEEDDEDDEDEDDEEHVERGLFGGLSIPRSAGGVASVFGGAAAAAAGTMGAALNATLSTASAMAHRTSGEEQRPRSRLALGLQRDDVDDEAEEDAWALDHEQAQDQGYGDDNDEDDGQEQAPTSASAPTPQRPAGFVPPPPEADEDEAEDAWAFGDDANHAGTVTETKAPQAADDTKEAYASSLTQSAPSQQEPAKSRQGPTTTAYSSTLASPAIDLDDGAEDAWDLGEEQAGEPSAVPAASTDASAIAVKDEPDESRQGQRPEISHASEADKDTTEVQVAPTIPASQDVDKVVVDEGEVVHVKDEPEPEGSPEAQAEQVRQVKAEPEAEPEAEAEPEPEAEPTSTSAPGTSHPPASAAPPSTLQESAPAQAQDRDEASAPSTFPAAAIASGALADAVVGGVGEEGEENGWTFEDEDVIIPDTGTSEAPPAAAPVQASRALVEPEVGAHGEMMSDAALEDEYRAASASASKTLDGPAGAVDAPSPSTITAPAPPSASSPPLAASAPPPPARADSVIGADAAEEAEDDAWDIEDATPLVVPPPPDATSHASPLPSTAPPSTPSSSATTTTTHAESSKSDDAAAAAAAAVKTGDEVDEEEAWAF